MAAARLPTGSEIPRKHGGDIGWDLTLVGLNTYLNRHRFFHVGLLHEILIPLIHEMPFRILGSTTNQVSENLGLAIGNGDRKSEITTLSQICPLFH